ncbi:LD-carboxypeptidase [Pedobacter sp. JCM 36344]|uniref:S66 peptidase family protein n=1 Tax=Pedobacter sp. JCM 36344 TaxID=3374280 RepID=UPI0039780CB2
MKLKHFLSFLISISATLPAIKSLGNDNLLKSVSVLRFKIPPYLKQGDTIGITSPASYMLVEDIQPSINVMESWGFKVEIWKSVGQKDFTLGGTDTERAADFQTMFDDPDIKAIMCTRRGYGVVRMIEQLSFRKFKRHPKWIIGFSDITMLHTHINSRFAIATLHSKMCNSFPSEWTKATPIKIETILSIRQTLSGEPVKYSALASPGNRFGKVEGVLIGGNLSLIETAAGTSFDLNTDSKILFLEDTQEQLYSIDRMLWNLKRTGKLDRLKGLIVGGFKAKVDTSGNEFGKTVYDLVNEKELKYPVCFDFPVGHQVNNYPLKCGAQHILTVDQNGGSLVSI